MEHFGGLAQSKGVTDRAHARLCSWLDLRTVVSSTQRFDSILAIDPATVASVRAGQLQEFYTVLADCAAPGATVTVLALYVDSDLAAVDARRGSFFKNEFSPVRPIIDCISLDFQLWHGLASCAAPATYTWNSVLCLEFALVMMSHGSDCGCL